MFNNFLVSYHKNQTQNNIFLMKIKVLNNILLVSKIYHNYFIVSTYKLKLSSLVV